MVKNFSTICPKCGSENLERTYNTSNHLDNFCKVCNYRWYSKTAEQDEVSEKKNSSGLQEINS